MIEAEIDSEDPSAPDVAIFVTADEDENEDIPVDESDRTIYDVIKKLPGFGEVNMLRGLYVFK